MNSQFKVVSTFSGCGGSSLGYTLAGYKVLLAVEFDAHAVESYKLNFPNTPIYHGDINDLSLEEVFERTGLVEGELDLFDGSPPCQGFSTAGFSRFSDNRNQLYHQYVRLLRGLKPKTFVMENVSGLVKGNMKLIFKDILTDLKQSGYRVSVRLMNAKYYGVPQARERLIFIGVREDLGIEPSHPKPQTQPIPVSAIIGDLDNTQRPEIDHVWLDESPKGKGSPKNWYRAVNAKEGEKYRFASSRNYWDRPSRTLNATGYHLGRGTCHPKYTRVHSVLEYKRLSSFPDDFKLAGDLKVRKNLQAAYTRIGNSVPPLLMKAIATHIKDNILSKTMLR